MILTLIVCLLSVQRVSSLALKSATWLIEDSGSATLPMLERLPLNVNSMVFLIQRISGTLFNIKEVYKPHSQHPLIVNVIGNWSRRTGLSMTSTSISERRGDLKGYQFRVAILPVYVLNTTVSFNHIDEFRFRATSHTIQRIRRK